MGKKRLEDALKQVDQQVEVRYRSFELDPTAERDTKYNMYEKLAQKYGMSVEQAKANTQNMVQMAAEVGLKYEIEKIVLTNTFNAHRLAMFADQHGKMHAMIDRILKAYYSEGKHIGDHATLTELAGEVGLDQEAASNMLASDEYSDAVRNDEQEAQQLGINSIPFFLINRKYAVTGAQPTEAFVQAINQIAEQDGPYNG